MELSVEFFPPKTPEGESKLHLVRERFSETLKPAFYSVTFGAGGSTQSGTLKVVSDIHAAGAAVAPHLSCVGSSRESVREMLKQYQALGVKRIVALRGDLHLAWVSMVNFIMLMNWWSLFALKPAIGFILMWLLTQKVILRLSRQQQMSTSLYRK